MSINVYTTLDDPKAGNGTYAYGINVSGQVVGYYLDYIGGGIHGFLYSGGTYTTLDDPAPGQTAKPLCRASTTRAGSSDFIGMGSEMRSASSKPGPAMPASSVPPETLRRSTGSAT